MLLNKNYFLNFVIFFFLVYGITISIGVTIYSVQILMIFFSILFGVNLLYKHKVDHATMSVSIEGREPFLDYRIIAFVLRLPSDMKIQNGDTKLLLKQITHRYFPKEIVERPKMGFGIPIEQWLKGGLKEYVEEFLNENIDSVMDGKELEKQSYLGRINPTLIWNIVVFQMWYKRCM